MRKGTDKALVVLACALLIGVLGAVAQPLLEKPLRGWNADPALGRLHGAPQAQEGAGGAANFEKVPAALEKAPAGLDRNARDEVLYKAEKLHSIWGNYDKGAGSEAGAKSNP